MNTDRAKEFKPYEGVYRYVDALRDRKSIRTIDQFNAIYNTKFTDTVEEWERPDLGSRPAGPRMYTPYKAIDKARNRGGYYPDSIIDTLRACPDNYWFEDLRGRIFDGESIECTLCEARPKNLFDGESYQPFINWEL